MEAIVNQVIGLSGNDGHHADLNQLHTYLKTQDTFLNGHVGGIPQALNALDPSLHSLGVLYLLDALCKGAGLVAHGDGLLVDQVAQFLRQAAPSQVQLEPAKFCRVARKLKDLQIDAATPRRAILPLLSAVRKLQPSPEHLTPLHADCFQLCLLAKIHNAAAPLLADDIFTVDPALTAVTPADLLLYCYYGGMLAIGQKRYARAMELLLQGLTVPSVVSSAITLATYKKYLLASLVHTGSLAPLPKFTPSRVRQMADSDSRPYNDLAAAVASHNADRARKALEQHTPVFTTDGNLGLAKLAVQSLTKRSIQRLTQTYVTLAAADIAAQVGLRSAEQAEEHILRMVEAGEIHAVISQRDGMVRFLEDPEQYCSAATSARVDGHIRQCVELAAKLEQVHDMVSCDRQYLSKVVTRGSARTMDMDDYGAGSSLYQP